MAKAGVAPRLCLQPVRRLAGAAECLATPACPPVASPHVPLHEVGLQQVLTERLRLDAVLTDEAEGVDAHYGSFPPPGQNFFAARMPQHNHDAATAEQAASAEPRRNKLAYLMAAAAQMAGQTAGAGTGSLHHTCTCRAASLCKSAGM